jgi:hypothetical protein
MSFINDYTPPSPKGPINLPDPTKPYDVNFCFPVKDLETDRVKVVPYIVSKEPPHLFYFTDKAQPHLHATALFNAITANPEVMRYMPCSTPATLEEFEVFCEVSYRLDTSRCLYVVLDKTKLAPGDETNTEKGLSPA